VPERVMLDDGRFRQIAINLVDNAIKFTDQGSVAISLDAATSDADQESVDLYLRVRDTGIGIAEDQKEYIFGSFNQHQGRNHVRYGGSGLGLSLTRQLVQLMGGEISVDSRLDHGSTFEVFIKDVAQGQELPGELSEAQNLEALSELARQGGFRFGAAAVVIADDVPVNRSILKQYLKGYGLTLYEAEDGKQVVDIIHEKQVDLLLLDMKMPGKNGHEVMEYLRSRPAFKEIPIIAVTGSSGQSIQEERERSDGYLQKPIEKAGLLVQLLRFLPYERLEDIKDTKQFEDFEEKTQEQALAQGSERAEELSGERRRELENLLQKLAGDLMVEWRGLSQILIMAEVKSFENKVRAVAQEHSYEPLRQWVDDLKKMITMFDTEGIQKKLKDFPDLEGGLRALLAD
jgi:CheY-like chemotaxis protein